MKQKKEKTFEELSIKERRKQLQATIDKTEGIGKDDLARPEERMPRIDELNLMRLIWSTEPMRFFDLCNALRLVGECPVKGDKQEWAILFSRLNTIEKLQWIECTRIGRSIETLQLTDLGSDVVRNFADSKRKLFHLEEEEEPTIKVEWNPNKYKFSKDIPF